MPQFSLGTPASTFLGTPCFEGGRCKILHTLQVAYRESLPRVGKWLRGRDLNPRPSGYEPCPNYTGASWIWNNYLSLNNMQHEQYMPHVRYLGTLYPFCLGTQAIMVISAPGSHIIRRPRARASRNALLSVSGPRNHEGGLMLVERGRISRSFR